MTYERTFKDAERAALNSNLKNSRDDFAFQFIVTGEGAGTFYIAKQDGQFAIKPFDYHDNTATIYGEVDTLVRLIGGRLNLERAVEADIIKVIDGPEKGNGYFKANRIFGALTLPEIGNRDNEYGGYFDAYHISL